MNAVRNHLHKTNTLLIMLLAMFAFLSVGFHHYAFDENKDTAGHKADDLAIWVFYKEQPPSLQTRSIIKDFLSDYEDSYAVEFRLITDPDQKQTIESLGLSTDHLPVAIAINGKTSAMIDGEEIVFVNFPDVMHHIGRHPGNWTLEHLQKVLNDNSLLLDENPDIKNRPGGKKE